MRKSLSLAVALSLSLTACAGLAPQRQAPPATGEATVQAVVPSSFAAVPGDNAVIGLAADLPWSTYFADPQLRDLIDRALRNNRDLRMAVINVEKARAQVRIARSPLVPSVNVGSQASIGPGDDTYQTGANAAYELDLFGKLRNQSAAAQESLLSQEQNARSAKSALVSQIAQLYLTTLADRAQLHWRLQRLRPIRAPWIWWTSVIRSGWPAVWSWRRRARKSNLRVTRRRNIAARSSKMKTY